LAEREDSIVGVASPSINGYGAPLIWTVDH
jgi:hypothetical protein